MGTIADREKMLDAIERQVFSDPARYMMEHGIYLTFEEVDRIGDAGDSWLRSRLNLVCTTDDKGAHYQPCEE